jgi:serine/threonine-protein kinase
MEFIEGDDIYRYLSKNPESCSDIFEQIIDGFCYLESQQIVHRDIRPQNILISNSGHAKIIDFGFGTRIDKSHDALKSVNLNWWCDTPNEFQDGVYDFATDIYFIGKVFEHAIRKFELTDFKYNTIVNKMCAKNRIDRYSEFADILKSLNEGQFEAMKFSDDQIAAYREFAEFLYNCLNRIDSGTTYNRNVVEIIQKLTQLYKNTMLETHIPKVTEISNIFLNGAYNYSSQRLCQVGVLKAFLDLLSSSGTERRNIILNNLFTKIDSIPRFNINSDLDDAIPF